MVESAAGATRHERRWVFPLLVWTAVALAVGALAARGEATSIWQAIHLARPAPLVLLAAVALALPCVYAVRWRALLRAVQEELPVPAAVEILATASLVSYAAPGYLALPARGLLARQFRGIGLARSVPTLAAEQGIDLLTLVAGSAVGLILVGPSASSGLRHDVHGPDAVWLLAGAAALVLLLLAVLALVRTRLRRAAGPLLAATRALLANRAERRPILLLSGLRWLLDITGIWLAAAAIGVHLGLGAALLIANLPLLLGQLSPMPGGLGFREGAMAAVAAALGLPATAILAAAIVHRALLVAALPALLLVVRLQRWAVAWR